MNNLGNFELIAAIASILALALMLATYALNLWKSFKQKRGKAEQEFKQMMDQLQATGGTVTARTDLGFFILIELGSLRDEIYSRRSHSILCAIIVASLLVTLMKLDGNTMFFKFTYIFMLIVLCFSLAMYVLAFRSQRYVWLYERRIQDVWLKAIDKRLTSNDDLTGHKE